MLIERFTLDPSRLAAADYGEHHPLADKATAEGRERNRRVDGMIPNPTVTEIDSP